MIEQAEIPIPPSVNKIWKIVAPRGGRPFLARTAHYKNWLKEVVPLLRLTIPPAVLPACLTVTIRGGKGWTASRDLDNVLKAILDALVHAQRIPDDTTQYVHALNLRYCPPEAGRTAACVISYEVR